MDTRGFRDSKGNVTDEQIVQLVRDYRETLFSQIVGSTRDQVDSIFLLEDLNHSQSQIN